MARFHTFVSDVTSLSPSILGLSFQRQDRQPFPQFFPGQYATLSFPKYSTIHGERSFSIASSATDLSTLSFGIRVGGKYTRALSRLRTGDEAMVNAPFGQFTFEPIRDQSAVLIAGGIGITPFMSMIRTAISMGLNNDLRLIYCIRSIVDAAFVEELEFLTKQSPNFQVTYMVGDKRVPSGVSHFLPGYISQGVLADVLGENPWGRSYFLCGPPKFMTMVTKIFSVMGLPKRALRTERFSVGSTALIEGGSPIPKWAFASWGVATVAVLGFIAHNEKEKRDAIALANMIVPAVTTTTTSPTSTTTSTPVNTPVTTNTFAPTTPVTLTPNITPTPTPKPVVTQPTPVYTAPVFVRPRTTVS